jgi:hypothetical protein
MVVHQILLEQLHFLIVEKGFREFTDTGINTVHDFFLLKFPGYHPPAESDSFLSCG